MFLTAQTLQQDFLLENKPCFFSNSAVPYFAVSTLLHLLVLSILFFYFSHTSPEVANHSNMLHITVVSGSEAKTTSNAINHQLLQKDKVIRRKKSNLAGDIQQSRQKNQKLGNQNSQNQQGAHINLSENGDQQSNVTYGHMIASQIEKNKSHINMDYAPSNVKNEIILKITLDMEGNLSSYKIVKHSDHRFFDKAAKKIIQISSPFPTPPLNLLNSLEFTVPIRFDTT